MITDTKKVIQRALDNLPFGRLFLRTLSDTQAALPLFMGSPDGHFSHPLNATYHGPNVRQNSYIKLCWAHDRLGRNYDGVCDTIREFMRRGVVIRTVINNFTFDGATADPMQRAVRDALIAFMAATAQAQAEATKAAQRAGIEHAKAKDRAAYLGRKPSYTRQQFTMVRGMLVQDAVGIARIAKETGLTRQTVYRIKDDPAGAEAALTVWGM
jgi:putative DNA-invertase from lambdoid prophage Rac